MEKYKFIGSPAPWTIENDISLVREIPSYDGRTGFNFQSGRIYDANNLILGEVRSHDTGGFAPLSKVEANAALVLSAPLLLSALIKAIEYEDGIQEDIRELSPIPNISLPDWYNEAKNAVEAALNINKATRTSKNKVYDTPTT